MKEGQARRRAQHVQSLQGAELGCAMSPVSAEDQGTFGLSWAGAAGHGRPGHFCDLEAESGQQGLGLGTRSGPRQQFPEV